MPPAAIKCATIRCQAVAQCQVWSTTCDELVSLCLGCARTALREGLAREKVRRDEREFTSTERQTLRRAIRLAVDFAAVRERPYPSALGALVAMALLPSHEAAEIEGRLRCAAERTPSPSK